MSSHQMGNEIHQTPIIDTIDNLSSSYSKFKVKDDTNNALYNPLEKGVLADQHISSYNNNNSQDDNPSSSTFLSPPGTNQLVQRRPSTGISPHGDGTASEALVKAIDNAPAITPQELAIMLPKQPLLIDIRHQPDYDYSRIKGSIHVNLPTLLLKRYRRGTVSNFSLESFITTSQGTYDYTQWLHQRQSMHAADHSSTVVVYDDKMDVKDKTTLAWTLVGALSTFFATDANENNIKATVVWLKGGYNAFEQWDQHFDYIDRQSPMLLDSITPCHQDELQHQQYQQYQRCETTQLPDRAVCQTGGQGHEHPMVNTKQQQRHQQGDLSTFLKSDDHSKIATINSNNITAASSSSHGLSVPKVVPVLSRSATTFSSAPHLVTNPNMQRRASLFTLDTTNVRSKHRSPPQLQSTGAPTFRNRRRRDRSTIATLPDIDDTATSSHAVAATAAASAMPAAPACLPRNGHTLSLAKNGLSTSPLPSASSSSSSSSSSAISPEFATCLDYTPPPISPFARTIPLPAPPPPPNEEISSSSATTSSSTSLSSSLLAPAPPPPSLSSSSSLPPPPLPPPSSISSSSSSSVVSSNMINNGSLGALRQSDKDNDHMDCQYDCDEDDGLESEQEPTPMTENEYAFIVSAIIPDFLYLGPEISTIEQMHGLKERSIRRILNVAEECDDDVPGLKESFHYSKLSARDTVEMQNVESTLRQAVQIIGEAKRHHEPIYVHCKAGKSRSVAVILAYFVLSERWSLRRAYRHVIKARPWVSPNIGFVAELIKLEESVLGRASNFAGTDWHKIDITSPPSPASQKQIGLIQRAWRRSISSTTVNNTESPLSNVSSRQQQQEQQQKQ